MRFKLLTEDKTVNPGGRPYPNFGWAVILCGGPGMGKSSAYDNLINIEGKHLDVDEVKSLWLKMTVFDGCILKTADGKEYDLSKEGIDEPYDLSNPKFTSFVHNVTKPLASNRKNSFIGAAGSADSGRLPNVVFDITGDKLDKFTEIITTLKPMGYKIAVVYVAGEISQAIEQNKKRARSVDTDLLISKHRDVMYTISKLFDMGVVDNVDEFYTIVQFRVDITTREGKLEYIRKDNVIKCKTVNGKKIMPKQIASIMASELDKLESGYYSEN